MVIELEKIFEIFERISLVKRPTNIDTAALPHPLRNLTTDALGHAVIAIVRIQIRLVDLEGPVVRELQLEARLRCGGRH